jgi:hypothetical protein
LIIPKTYKETSQANSSTSMYRECLSGTREALQRKPSAVFVRLLTTQTPKLR